MTQATATPPEGLFDIAAEFRPGPPSNAAAAPLNLAEAEAASRTIAQRHGFTDRHVISQRRRNKPIDEPVISFSARFNLRDVNRFIEMCQERRISYREGFAHVVALLDRE